MRRKTKVYVLDTSALFAYIEDEAGAEMVEKLLVEAEKGDAEIHIRNKAGRTASQSIAAFKQ